MRRGVGVAAVMAVLLSARVGEASDFELTPALALSAEYNDNIFGTADGRKTDYVTRVQPGVRVHYLGRAVSLDTAYIFDYRNYARATHDDEEIHNLDLRGSLRIIDNILLVDFGDALHRTTVNVSRDVATENLLVRQTMQNIAFASPYLLWRGGEKTTTKTGYRYTDTRYFEGAGVDRREQVGFAELKHEPFDKLVLNTGYAFTHTGTAITDVDRHDLSCGFRYTLSPRSSLFGSVGNSWCRFSSGRSTSDFFWDAGISHDLGLAVALLETKVQNAEDPLSVSTRQISYLGRLDRAFTRGGASLSAEYSEYYIMETGKLEHRRGTVSTSGRYEIMQKITASGAILAERFSRSTPDEFPYRLTVNATVAYAFHKYLEASLSYTLNDDRLHLDSARGERMTNRVVLQIRTTL